MLDYTISSGNIFQDLGLVNAEEKLAKVKLASVIADILAEREIIPAKAGVILNLEIEKIDDLTNGRLKKFTIEQLLICLIKLDQKIEILVMNQSTQKTESNIDVIHQKAA